MEDIQFFGIQVNMKFLTPDFFPSKLQREVLDMWDDFNQETLAFLEYVGVCDPEYTFIPIV